MRAVRDKKGSSIVNVLTDLAALPKCTPPT
jgi:hypothetical protein